MKKDIFLGKKDDTSTEQFYVILDTHQNKSKTV